MMNERSTNNEASYKQPSEQMKCSITTVYDQHYYYYVLAYYAYLHNSSLYIITYMQ